MLRQAVLQVPGQKDRCAFRLPMRQASAVEHIGQVRIFGRFSHPAGETAGMAGLAAFSHTGSSKKPLLLA